jgi:hypothetical protein
MPAPKPKSAFIVVRVTPATRAKFTKKAEKFDKPSTVAREIIEAFVEDRLVIKPPVINPNETIYHVE